MQIDWHCFFFFFRRTKGDLNHLEPGRQICWCRLRKSSRRGVSLQPLGFSSMPRDVLRGSTVSILPSQLQAYWWRRQTSQGGQNSLSWNAFQSTTQKYQVCWFQIWGRVKETSTCSSWRHFCYKLLFVWRLAKRSSTGTCVDLRGVAVGWYFIMIIMASLGMTYPNWECLNMFEQFCNNLQTAKELYIYLYCTALWDVQNQQAYQEWSRSIHELSSTGGISFQAIHQGLPSATSQGECGGVSSTLKAMVSSWRIGSRVGQSNSTRRDGQWRG